MLSWWHETCAILLVGILFPGRFQPLWCALRILLADDHREAVEALAACFTLAGFSVRVAHDSTEALDIAIQWRPDVALSDIDMPNLDGLDLARRLRANDRTRHIVLIAVTARDTVDETRQAFEAGFEYHVLKPAQPEKLLTMVKACLEWV